MYLKRYTHTETKMVEQPLGEWIDVTEYETINKFHDHRLYIVKKDLNRCVASKIKLKNEIDWYRIIIGTEVVLAIIAGIIHVVRDYS